MNAEIIRNIKQQFYTYRNGLLADKLRNTGDSHKIIFGLNLPQIIAISENLEKSQNIAQFLWDNTSTRESQLLAPMIYPIESFDIETARLWIKTVSNTEIADILCHRLLRFLPFAKELYNEYINSDIDIVRYTAMRLALNLLALNKCDDNIDFLRNCATIEMDTKCNITKHLALSIIEEIDFRNE